MNRTTELAVPDQLRLVGALRAALPQPAEIIETHISWVLLAGDFAYKIKKTVDFGFLDFSTLEKRRYYCAEELRLNQRLSPQLYLEVVAITGGADAPTLGGAGEAIEYAVKMRRFPQSAQLDAMLAGGALHPAHIDEIARRLATFHQNTAIAGADSPYGVPEAVHQPARQNFAQIRSKLIAPADLEKLRQLEAWSEDEFRRLETVFSERKQHGFIRECHGDLHLANLALFEGEIAPFDCIEFNANLRWIDVVSEIAFLAMDLHDKKRPDLAWRLLNAYLEQTGDYPGLALLRYYLAYRALVRAKVACLRSAAEIAEGAALEGCRDYLNLAESFTRQAHPAIIITHGLSGSGKTTLGGELATELGAIRIRSDIERKRLYGLAADARSGSGLDDGLYTAEGHRRTYAKLAELAQAIIAAGYPVIVDAAFLKLAERAVFQRMAADSRVPYAILDFQAPVEVLRQRIREREQAGRDASEATQAVLERQLSSAEPLAVDEIALSLKIDSSAGAALRAAQQGSVSNLHPVAS
ncbi:MAG: AAA family ATPase [Sulfuricellaceae bacterium]